MNGSASQRALYFRLGSYALAVSGEGLRQVVTVGSLTRVPRVGPELLGLFSVRGEVLPLIDLRPLLGEGLPGPTASAGGLAALLEHQGRRIALALDEVWGFFPVHETPAQAAPALAALTLTHTTFDAHTAALLDLSKLMGALERQLVVA